MPNLEIASLWIGGSLSWLEQLCLKSYVDAGHRTTLFTYDKVEGVPEGVHVEDANSIYPSTEFIVHARTGSPAYHADIFRLHMLRDTDLHWVDTDAYCVRPFELPDHGHLHGWISDNVAQVNNGFLHLPRDSKTLAAMLEFTSNEYPVPPWFSKRKQEELRAAKAAGAPVHVSLLPWGVWGPNALTHFLHETGEIKYSQPGHVIYPVPFSHKRALLKPRRRHKVEEWVNEETISIHFWGRRFRAAVSETGGIPVEGSYTLDLLRKHGIDPEPTAHLMQPVGKPAVVKPLQSLQECRALLARIDRDDARVFADVSGENPLLAVAAHQKYGSKIALLNVDEEGRFVFGDREWIAPYLQALRDNGVPQDDISVIREGREAPKIDILSALRSFGVSGKIRHLRRLLENDLAHDGSLLVDIRQGLGGFPFLRHFGNCTTLEKWEHKDRPVSRVVMMAEPQEVRPLDGQWKKIAGTLIGTEGFYSANDRHSFTYIARSKTLCVTFDNLDIALNKRDDRRPWGFKFIENQGWSMLGVMANGWTWYRDVWVENSFLKLEKEGFFDQFDRVIFYGASMGGYGALTFSSVVKGSHVVAFSPQTILDKSVVPWETRYRVAWEYDYSGRFGDAAYTTSNAGRVDLFYDPYSPLDAQHIDRLSGENIRHFRSPFFGHRLGSMMQQLGILQPLVLGAVDETLDERSFHTLLRHRRSSRRYRKEMVNRLLDRGHEKCAADLCRYVLRDGDDRFFRTTLERLENALGIAP